MLRGAGKATGVSTLVSDDCGCAFDWPPRVADDPVAIVNATALIVSNASLQLRVAQPSVRYTSSLAGGSRTSRRGVGFSLVTIRS
jgi:hypothetical protein